MTELRLESIDIQGPRGPIQARLARPDGQAPFPAVLLLQEGLGVTQHLLRLAQRFAEAGYLTLVPNLYSREPLHRALRESEVLEGIPIARAADRAARLAALPAERRASVQRVIDWFDARDPSSYYPDTQAALQYLAQHDAVRADAIASVGFSFGGGLSAQLAAAGSALAAGVIFYGQGPQPEQLSGIRYPLLGHYAEDDPTITPAVPQLEQALKQAGKSFTAHVYPRTQHGFFSDSRPVYQREAAELAFTRTLAFFGQHLRRSDVAAAE